MVSFPTWTTPKKSFTLSLNKAQAEELLGILQSEVTDATLTDLTEEEYNNLFEQLTTITEGE